MTFDALRALPDAGTIDAAASAIGAAGKKVVATVDTISPVGSSVGAKGGGIGAAGPRCPGRTLQLGRRSGRCGMRIRIVQALEVRAR
ncbi:hypothetical protein ASF23_14795 [Curtobacterium sp. Leaf261]|nr:hypothetical protein ASF23_14795 [Curtobacterium sp. Leaf261]